MLPGTKQIRMAADIVCNESHPFEERLADAMLAFTVACDAIQQWPPELQHRGNEILRLIFQHGTVKTTATAMEQYEYEAFKEKLCDFAQDAEQYSEYRETDQVSQPTQRR